MPYTIMIVDDDPDDRELFCEAVKELDKNLVCREASGGHEALLLLNDNDQPLPDFIFLDLNMPRLNGKQCLLQIKKKPEFQSIPVIIYSTSKREEDVKEVTAMGAVMFLTKPSKQSDLMKAIKHILKKQWEKSYTEVNPQ